MTTRLFRAASLCAGLTCLLSAPVHAAGPPFKFGPTDIQNVAGVTPLGNLNPGGNHVLAVDHMYIGYPFPETAGAFSYPVYAMAGGELVMLFRTPVSGTSDQSYQIFIRHNASLTFYYDHVHVLSDRILNYLASDPAGWVSVGGGDFQVMVFGQGGAPPPLRLSAGEEVAITKSYTSAWDVGVIDRRVRADLIGRGPRRYPGYAALFSAAGLNLVSPRLGNKITHAACFINYLPLALKAAWFALLTSDPQSCGADGWDVVGRLRGAWFNSAVDAAATPPVFDLEQAALSIIPDNNNPTARVQIGVGSGGTYSALDPAGAYPELKHPFVIQIDTLSTHVNPDPASVAVSTGTVCYDLSYNHMGGPRYETLLFHMLGSRRVAVKYDPAWQSSPQCGFMTLPSSPDASWSVYKR